jgi:hypothetical protein
MTEETEPQPEKQRVTVGRPFTKGDPRINRKGRPRSFEQLRQLAQSVLNEPAKDENGKWVLEEGHVVTRGELILRQMAANPRQQNQVLEVAYGKVPQAIDVTTGGEKLNNGTELDATRLARLASLLAEAEAARSAQANKATGEQPAPDTH